MIAQEKSIIYDRLSSPAMVTYLQHKYDLRPSSIESIQWSLLQSVYNGQSFKQRRFITKWLYGWLPSPLLVSRTSGTTATCPLCHNPSTSDHHFYCPSLPFDWQQYETHLKQAAKAPRHMPNGISRFVQQLRAIWSHPTQRTESVPNRLIVRGMWPTSCFPTHPQSPVSVRRLLQSHWQFCQARWQHYCNSLHSTQSQVTNRHQAQIQRIFHLNEALPSHLQLSLPHALTHYCSLSIPSQSTWIRQMLPRLIARQAARRAQARLRIQGLQNFFPNLHEPD